MSPTKLSSPVSRQVRIAGQDYVVTIGQDSVSVRAAGYSKAATIAYKDIAAQWLEQAIAAHNLRLPDTLRHDPLDALRHLSRRKTGF